MDLITSIFFLIVFLSPACLLACMKVSNRPLGKDFIIKYVCLILFLTENNTLHAFKLSFTKLARDVLHLGISFYFAYKTSLLFYFNNVTTYQGFPTVMSLRLSQFKSVVLLVFCFLFVCVVDSSSREARPSYLCLSVIVVFNIAGLTGGGLEPQITERPKSNVGKP